MLRLLLGMICVILIGAVSAAEPVPENWRELAAGKTITLTTNQHARTFGSDEGLVEWMEYKEGGGLRLNPEMSKLASDATKEKYPERNKLRFRVFEDYAGSVEGLSLPLIPKDTSMFSTASLMKIPYGARKVIYMHVPDLRPPHVKLEFTAGIIVVAYEDLPLDVLRRVALEDGVLRAIRVKDAGFFNLKGDELIKGAVPNKMLIQEAVVTEIDGIKVSGGAILPNGVMGGSPGAQIGGGYTGTFGGAAGGAIIEVLLLGKR